MKTNRFIVFLTFLVLLIPIIVFAADAAPATSGGAWSGVQWIIPFLAPVLVMLIKKVPGWFETKFSKNLLPYLCVGVAFLLMLVLDMVGKLTIPLWIAGPIAGAVGIGSRELLDKGLALLGIKTSTPEVTPPDSSGVPK